MEISSLHWAFEPHKRTCNSDYTVNGPSTCQRSTSWWIGDQPNSRTSELGLLEPVNTEGSLEHLSGEGLSKEGALSTSYPSDDSILPLSFSSNLEDCPLQLAAVPFIVLCPKSPQWNVYWATLTLNHKARTWSRYFRHQALPSDHHYGWFSCLISPCIWNLERWYWWTYLQGSNGDADVEKRLVDTGREGEGGTNWEGNMETYTLPYVK